MSSCCHQTCDDLQLQSSKWRERLDIHDASHVPTQNYMSYVATSGLLTARAAAEKRDSGDPVLVLALGLR